MVASGKGREGPGREGLPPFISPCPNPKKIRSFPLVAHSLNGSLLQAVHLVKAIRSRKNCVGIFMEFQPVLSTDHGLTLAFPAG